MSLSLKAELCPRSDDNTPFVSRHISCVKEQPPCHRRQSRCCAPSPSLASFLCSRRATITRRRRPPSLSARCRFERVAFENENATREFVGVVRARYETDLGFRVAGKMVSRVVNVGDRVKVGDVVARLDPQDLKLQVESAEAEFAAATSSLQQTLSDLRTLYHAEGSRLGFDR